jgi:hypothetical protein
LILKVAVEMGMWRNAPFRLWSLPNVIPHFATYFWKVNELLLALERLMEPKPPSTSTTKAALGIATMGEPLGSLMPSTAMEPTHVDRLLGWLAELEKSDTELSLPRTNKRIARIRQYIKFNVVKPMVTLYGDAKLTAEIKVLREALEDDLSDRLIFFPEQDKVKQFYEKPLLFGAKVSEAFPDARNDIQSAGSCYATNNDTACALHCFRIAEYGLKGLAGHLCKPKNNQSRSDAIGTASWGVIIAQLRKCIQDMNAQQPQLTSKLGKSKRPVSQKKRKARLDFYSAALDNCAYFNQARIDAAHVYRKGFNPSEALGVMMRVEEFMSFLAKNGIKLAPHLPK